MAVKRIAIKLSCNHPQPLSFIDCVAALCDDPSLVVLCASPGEISAVQRVLEGVPIMEIVARKIKVHPPNARTKELALQRGIDKMEAQVPITQQQQPRGKKRVSRKEKKKQKTLKRLRAKEMERERLEEESHAAASKKRKRRKKKAKQEDDVHL